MRRTMVGRAVGAAVVCASVVGFLAPAASATAQHSSAAGFDFNLGPPPVALPANCPAILSSGAGHLLFLDGNMVERATTNANREVSGTTIEGTAVFSVNGQALYQGHAALSSQGSGSTVGLQGEFTFTVDYHGTGALGTQTIHAVLHVTGNNDGTITSNVLHVTTVCG